MRPAELPEILAAPDARGQICTLASLEASVVVWPQGDESRELRIEMPGEGVAASSTQNCSVETSVRPLLVVSWSTFQLCFFISKVSLPSFAFNRRIHDIVYAQSERNWTLDQVTFVFNTSDVPLGLAKSKQRITRITEQGWERANDNSEFSRTQDPLATRFLYTPFLSSR